MNFSHKSANHLRNLGMAFAISITLLLASSAARAQKDADEYLFNDSHFHLTNYIQEGIDIHDFLKVMGNKADVLLSSAFHCNNNGRIASMKIVVQLTT
jgi:hypothetical protein